MSSRVLRCVIALVLVAALSACGGDTTTSDPVLGGADFEAIARPASADEAATVPGNAVTGGDRVLTIGDGSRRDGGLWSAIRRQIWQTTGWSPRGRVGLQHPAGRLE